MAIYVPIIMYSLRLFIVVLQELHCLQICYSMVVMDIYQYAKFRFSTLSGDTRVETEEQQQQQQ